MSNNSKKIKSLLHSWLKKSRETKKTQKVLAAKLKAIIAHVEWRAEVEELNEIQSLAGMIFLNFKICINFLYLEDFITEIATNLNEAVEQALNDFDNLSPRKKTSMKSMKSRKRKTEKSAAKLPKKSKPVKADEFFDVEAEEGNFTNDFYS